MTELVCKYETLCTGAFCKVAITSTTAAQKQAVAQRTACRLETMELLSSHLSCFYKGVSNALQQLGPEQRQGGDHSLPSYREAALFVDALIVSVGQLPLHGPSC